MSIQWSLVLFTALTGTAGWGFAALAVDEFAGKVSRSNKFFIGLVLLIVLIVGGCLSVTHLSHPENILGALQHPTSGIFVEALLVGITAVLAVIYLILVKRESAENVIKVFAVLTAVVGVVLSFMAGESYMMSSRESWDTILLPLGYAGTAAPAGVALFMLLAAIKGEKELGNMPTILAGAGILAAVTAAAYAVASGDSADALVIWGLAVVVGGVATAALGFVLKNKADQLLSISGAALACGLVGAIAYRCFMWMCATSIANFFMMTI